MEKLKLGTAYHGNRMLGHVREDMLDIVKHNMNLVVHMFTHNDMERHKNVMKDIIAVTEDTGLECWIDNWGLWGPPGDLSHILQVYRDSHQITNEGEVHPTRICFNSPGALEFTKQWIDMVAEAGGKTIFWDEPHLLHEFGKDKFTCCCPRCKKIFEERYNMEMPTIFTDEVADFCDWTIHNFFMQVAKYAKEAGVKNVLCQFSGNLNLMKALSEIDAMDGIGIDPYWSDDINAYERVYGRSKAFLDRTAEIDCEKHIWIKGFGIKNGFEDNIYAGTQAAYDAGARTILSWSFRGGEACDYRMQCPDLGWHTIGEAMRRVKEKHLDNCLKKEYENRDIYLNNWLEERAKKK